jgi:purine-binding chemotaxis protein CheW
VTDPAAAADAGTVARVLADRARALARPLHDEVAGESVELVVLAVGPERYGLEARYVIELQTLSGLARVPGLPPVWAGIVNLRGTLWPVLDLRVFLSLPDSGEPRGPGKVALVAGVGLTVGLLVDDTLEIVRVPMSRIGPPLMGVPGAARGEVRGVTADLVTVLDVEQLLADSRLVVREESA